MARHPFYVLFGILVVALSAVAEWRGWSPVGATEVHDVPRTVRDNPGSYRPHYHYSGYGYRRGK